MARTHKNDTDLNREQDRAAHASRNGSGAVADASAAEASSGGGLGRLLLLALLAAVLALVLSKDVRAKVLDLLFGAEEEFDYSSTTMPATDFSSVGAPAS